MLAPLGNAMREAQHSGAKFEVGEKVQQVANLRKLLVPFKGN